MRFPHHSSTTSTANVTSRFSAASMAMVAITAVGFGLAVPSHPVRAESGAQTVQTPFGRAPLSFADIVDKVKPAVVSVSVINDGGASKLASNEKGKKGDKNFTLPDLPPDHPLHDFFKNLPKEFGQEEKPKI